MNSYHQAETLKGNRGSMIRTVQRTAYVETLLYAI